ncbi:class I SAM-dependent methyltransferase [Streptomyces rubiginosohelvolus]|uniref:class I SAM-dependent methyltransferase n=1 Tax=Streptomyces rubiginosohelvolus TaxID=67362 RepID=UPI0035D81B03
MSNLELGSLRDAVHGETDNEDRCLRSWADGRMELVRTQALLRRFLPPSAGACARRGRGTGVHAEWLVKDGYDVALVDPVPRHVEAALAVCPAVVGDARDLPEPDDTFDVVQLYYLPDPADRRQALAEASRVAKPGGLVAAAAINRYASLFEHVTYAHLHTERIHDSVSKILETAVYDGVGGFTLSYFHRAEELLAELVTSGLEHVQVFGIEGPAWSLVKTAEQQPGEGLTEELIASAMAAARWQSRTRSYSRLAHTSWPLEESLLPPTVDSCSTSRGRTSTKLGSTVEAGPIYEKSPSVVSQGLYRGAMTPTDDNPAARLREVLLAVHATYSHKRAQEPISSWQDFAQVLEVEQHSTAGLHAIAGVARLPDLVIEGIRALGEEPEEEEHLLLHLDGLQNAMASLIARNSLYQVFSIFAPGGEVPKSAAVHSLASAARALHRAAPVHSISDEDVARLEELVVNLMGEVGATKLPPNVSLLLLHHLQALLQSVQMVRIYGRGSVEGTFDAFVGAVLRRPETVEPLREANLMERFSEWIATVNGIISIGTGAAGLGQQVMRVLGP